MQTGVLTQVVLPISLFIIMFGMGLSLKVADFTRVFKEPLAVSLGVACQLIGLPLLGVFIVLLFGFSNELAVGLMVLTFCPGGTTSNMISHLSRGDVALSISLTAIVSVVTPFTIPLFTALAMNAYLDNVQAFQLPVGKTMMQLALITILPVTFGMFIHKKAPAFSLKADKPVKIFSVVFLFVIIAGIVAKNRSDMAGFFVQTGAATLTLNVLALAFGFFVAKWTKLSKQQMITTGIEVGIQNGTIALLVTGTLLANPLMTIPTVTYSLLMFVTGGVFGFLVNSTNKN